VLVLVSCLSYYVDKAVNENILSKAKTRRAVIDLCNFLGYTLATQTPSKYLIVFVKGSDFVSKEVTLHKGTKISTDPSKDNPVVFELDSDITIPAGKIGNEQDANNAYIYGVTATQGETVSDDSLATGNGEANQLVPVNYDDVMPDTLEISTLENGVQKQWTKVENFLDSLPTDRNYIAHVDEFNGVTLEFGDGVTGMKCPQGAAIQGTFRLGGGLIGNVGVNTINTLVDEDVAELAYLTNPSTAIIYGVDPEDIEHARQLAPKAFRTNGRAVTASDFETFALTHSGVGKAKAVESYNSNDDITLYILSDTYVATTDALKAAVAADIKDIMLLKENLIIQDASILSYDVGITVRLGNNVNADLVKTTITQNVTSLLDCSKYDIGVSIPLALIIKEVMNVDGVIDIQITTPTAAITPSATALAKLGTLTVTIGA
jgi:predicted phage baseplate assembly protein